MKRRVVETQSHRGAALYAWFLAELKGVHASSTLLARESGSADTSFQKKLPLYDAGIDGGVFASKRAGGQVGAAGARYTYSPSKAPPA